MEIKKNESFRINNNNNNYQINNFPDFKYELDLSKIFAVGLINLGNTCFMNSCLQCFYHCSEFTIELLKNLIITMIER